MSSESSTSSSPQATPPSSVTESVKNGCEITASPQSMIRLRPSFTNTWPSCRSSCWRVSVTPYDASSSTSSRTYAVAGPNRGSTSGRCPSPAYRSVSGSGRRAGGLEGGGDVGGALEDVVPAVQAELLRDHLAQPFAGVAHQQPAAVEVPAQQRRHPRRHPLGDAVDDVHLVHEGGGVRLEPHRA